jgi:hypothetical protein
MIKIAIHGVPRSGTTWLGEIINSSPIVCYKYQPLFSYSLKSFLGADSTSEQIDDFFQLLLKSNDPFCEQVESRNAGELPSFEKEKKPLLIAYKEVRYHNILYNIARRDPSIKFIFLIRDPAEVLASWFHAPREFRKDLGWNFEEEWRYAFKKNQNQPENYFGFEKWKESALIFLDLQSRFPERVRVLNYSEFRNDLYPKTQNLFDFMEIPLGQQTLDFLNSSTEKDALTEYGVYRVEKKRSQFLRENFRSIWQEIYIELKAGPLEKYLDL